MIQTVINNLSFLTLLTNAVIVIGFLLFLLSWAQINKTYWKKVTNAIKERGILLSFVVSLTATLGSLFLSEIAGFTPCKLCWFQRIFMYPLPFIFGIALFKKTKDVFQYAKPLALVGVLIATYHYYLQLNPEPLAPCSTVGFSISCSSRFVTHFGYITIPFMSLTAFLLILIFSFISLYNKK